MKKNKQLYLRGRGRERIREHIERQNLLVREREQLAEKLPLRKRLKDLFKKQFHPCNRCDCCWHNDWCSC